LTPSISIPALDSGTSLLALMLQSWGEARLKPEVKAGIILAEQKNQQHQQTKTLKKQS
jgi:hypothetical protein